MGIMVKNPGYLSLAPSHVVVSSGGDADIFSHWSTLYSSSWTPKKAQVPIENNTMISTGFVKNMTRIESPTSVDHDAFVSTYRVTHTDTLSPKRLGTASSRIATSDTRSLGGFATSSKTSPIKWSQRRGSIPPTRPLLETKKPKDPIELENMGMGPSEYSTSAAEAWLHPAEAANRKMAGSPFRLETPTSPGAGLPGPKPQTAAGNTSTGWRENNTLREHPWVHPGAVPHSSTYREDNKPGALMQAVSGYNERSSSELPTSGSGFVRAGRKVPLGVSQLLPHERISTTHLAYMQGRTAPMQGLVVEIAPRAGTGRPLGQSGFLKNAPNSAGSVMPASQDQGNWDPADSYRTTTGMTYEHPGLRPGTQAGDSVVPVAGLSSAYARSVVPVDNLMEPPVHVHRLHPTVASMMAKRDPYYYNTATFKVTHM
uniref:Uncharacterized protein n=1 Tax=Hemiselmis andersenii TaxID=464988 RepID=A0A7S1DG42_HEMAN